LDRACGSDAGLRTQIEEMIAALERNPEFLSSPTAGGAVPDPLPESRGLDSRSGSYRLSSRIGEGGVGTVYLAEQLPPVERRVAVKILKTGRNDDRASALFDAELQTLALMDHPNIARVYDAGAIGGRPFFVMELVEGVPITRYCDEHRLSVRERLRLFS